jgi:Immunoglobulin-like domain of bacterial spore germination
MRPRWLPAGVRKGAVTLLAVLAAACGALPSRADAAVTATNIRIANHSAFVRVVVLFEGGRVRNADVFATDPRPFRDGRGRIMIDKLAIDADAAPERAVGVEASLVQGTNRIVLHAWSDRHRFKYIAYAIRRSPQRLAVDLWKARPPRAGAKFPIAPQGGCLTIDSFSVGPGTASAAGKEHCVFEHMFQVTLRNRAGRVVRTVGVTSAAGTWSRSFSYTVSVRQAGTLEAVDLSEKDGALACIAQVRVGLRRPTA